MYSKKTEAWINEIAKKNNCTREEVIKYCFNLSSKSKVLSHLILVDKPQ